MEQTDEITIGKEQKLVRELTGLDESTEISFSDFGWTSRVYIINEGEIVFKFPRSEQVKKEYALETAAYKIAYGVGGVSIPKIKWEHPNKNYLGYRGVVGEGLDKIISTLTVGQKHNIGVQLGTFLKKFHELNIANAPLKSPEKEFAQHKYKLELGLPDFEKYFTTAEITQIKQLIGQEYPQKMLELGFKKGLCHGDLGYWNIIYNSDKGVGIIDFGDVGYYDTSIDFAGMNDKEILDAALEAYGGDVSMEKIELRMKIIPVLDLPFFIGKKDRNGIDRTVERIRKVILH